MPTVTNRKLVDKLIKNNGHYEDDPRVVKIVEYRTPTGMTCWGIIYPMDRPENYDASQWVRNPKVIWKRPEE